MYTNGRLFAFGALGAATMLSGCASLSGYPARPETKTVISARQQMFFGQNADKDYDSAKTEDERRALRDDLVYGKMQVVVDQFEELRRELNATGTSVSVGSDLAVLALNGIAATTGGTATKSALAAASAGIVGAQGAINKDLYYQRTLPALLAQMDANFEKQRATIISNLARPDRSYP